MSLSGLQNLPIAELSSPGSADSAKISFFFKRNVDPLIPLEIFCSGKVSTKAAGRHSALFHSQQVSKRLWIITESEDMNVNHKFVTYTWYPCLPLKCLAELCSFFTGFLEHSVCW